MKEKINNIIELYKGSDIYDELKKYYISDDISQKEFDAIVKRVKEIIAEHNLSEYKFKSYTSNGRQDKLLLLLRNYYNLCIKVKNIDGKLKIYPVKLSEREHEKCYIEIIKKMVDYQFKSGKSIEEVFKIFEANIEALLNEIKEKLINNSMEPYYGCPAYIIGRVQFISECIKRIPEVNVDIDAVIQIMKKFENKYLKNRKYAFQYDEDFCEVDKQFYTDYDEIEKKYKIVLEIEKKLFPIVAKYWETYLTNPCNHSDNHYRYIMHTFSGGLVNPNLMKKACCALNTDELVVTPYGNCGLIYDINEESVDTLCTEDAGSWQCDKKIFVERGCPGRWQLLNPDGVNVWYELEKNSKLIMPLDFEKECKSNNVSCNGEILNNSKDLCYSEIFLNQNAKPVGVFYTDDCTDLSEIQMYAQKHNLPLIKISLKHQREIKGMSPLPNLSAK